MTDFFNEMLEPGGAVRGPYQALAEWLEQTSTEHLRQKRHEADLLFRRMGITFAVYGEGGDTERMIPFDFIPRLLGAEEWRRLQIGLEQRVRALNAFLHDIYHEGE